MADQNISHRGVIVSIEGSQASVEIVSTSACASCHAAGLCGASESSTKVINARIRPWESFQVGQEVDVCLSRNLGLKAVILSYVIPLLILLILILFLSIVTDSELLAGLIGIAGVGAWYFVLYLFRDSLRGEYEFTMIHRVGD